MYVLVGLI